ncbi:hypothetical protein Tco_1511379 [Tanacetum coccineum]
MSFVDFREEVNSYVDHIGYDALDIRDQGETMAVDEGNESSDAYCSSDDEDLSYVDFHTEVDDNVDWNKMEPVIGMRFDHPQQLKLCLANYGVANRAKKELADDKEQNQGKKKSFKVNKVTTRSREKTGECKSKSLHSPMKAINSGEGCSEPPK